MTLADDYNLRAETVTMNDVADFVDLFSEETSFTPTFSVTAPMTISSTAIDVAKLYTIGDLCFVSLKYRATIGGTSRFELRASLPFTPIASTYHNLTCNIGQPTAGSYLAGLCYTDGTNLIARLYNSSEMSATTVDVNINGFLRIV